MAPPAQISSARGRTDARQSNENRSRDISQLASARPPKRKNPKDVRVWEKRAARVTKTRKPKRDRPSQDNKYLHPCRWSKCGDSFATYNTLRRHFRDYHSRPGHWICEVEDCKKHSHGYTRPAGLESHMKSAHKRKSSEDHLDILHRTGYEDLDRWEEERKKTHRREAERETAEPENRAETTSATAPPTTPPAPVKTEDEPKTEPEAPVQRGAASSASFRCKSVGCKARFANHAELEQHENGSRAAYYCPVEGCTRGRGRVAFARAEARDNHLLVHAASVREQNKSHLEPVLCPGAQGVRSERVFPPTGPRRHLPSSAHTKTDKAYPCPDPGCTSSFDDAIALAQHRFRAHNNGELEFLCPVSTCRLSRKGHGFKTTRTLETHVKERHPGHKPERAASKQ